MTEHSITEVTDKFDNPAIRKAIVEHAKKYSDSAPAVEHKKNSKDKAIPKKWCSCCSDSRENNPIDNGEASFIRKAGGFATNPDKKLDDDTAIAIEQANYDEVPVFLVRQHSRCGAMGIIYAYNVYGSEYVRDHYGPQFVIMAMERANLFSEVEQLLPVTGVDDKGNKTHDFSYFEKRYGLPMIGDDAAKFQTCMALHQGETCFTAVDAECKGLGDTTKALFVYNHMAENGRRYVSEAIGKPMIKLPLPTEAQYEEKMNGILRLFPEQVRSKIVVESIAQQEWRAENEAAITKEARDHSVVQQPKKAYLVSSSFLADDPYTSAEAAGEALFLKLPGGVAIKADGKPKAVLGQFMELARAYKVPAFQIKQVSGGEQIDAIYDYHRSQESARQLVKTRGPHFIGMAMRRGALYTTVEKRLKDHAADKSVKPYDFDYYTTKLGISLSGEHAADFKKCMAVELGLTNYRAAKSLYDASVKEGRPLPEPVLFFENKVYDPKAKTFIDPSPLSADYNYAMAATPSERMRVLQVHVADSVTQYRASVRPESKGCGCGKKHGAPSPKAGS